MPSLEAQSAPPPASLRLATVKQTHKPHHTTWLRWRTLFPLSHPPTHMHALQRMLTSQLRWEEDSQTLAYTKSFLWSHDGQPMARELGEQWSASWTPAKDTVWYTPGAHVCMCVCVCEKGHIRDEEGIGPEKKHCPSGHILMWKGKRQNNREYVGVWLCTEECIAIVANAE